LFFGVTLENVFLMFLIAPMVSFCLFAAKIEFKKIFPLSYDKQALRKMTDYTKWMMLGGSAIYLLNWGDNIILRRFSTMEEIGIYNLGYQFFKGTIMIMAIIKVYFLPFISQNIDNKEKITDYLLTKRIKLLFLGGLLLGGLFFIMPYFVETLYKGRYENSVLVFRILVIGAVFALYSIFYDPIFSSLERYKLTQSVIAICVVFNLVLDYILVGRIGYIGAAIATSTTYFLMAVIKEVYFRKYCRSVVT
jgi:O-antigen/teichoic acid export membrane protein